MPSSKFTTQFNLSKCTLINNGANPPETAADSTAISGHFNLWPPSTAAVDQLILNLKAKDGDDTEANWEKIMLNFKKELDAKEEEEQLVKPRVLTTSDVVINSSSHSHGGGGDGGIEKVVRARVRAKFSVPLSRREMEKDFEDMGERRLPRKPKKRPKSVQNQLDTLFPGLWLTEINADLYRVSDTKKSSFAVCSSIKMATWVCPSNEPSYTYSVVMVNFQGCQEGEIGLLRNDEDGGLDFC